MPAHITRIEHAVCTPAIEYIPDRGPSYWLTAGVPRILNLSELADHLAG